MECKNCHTSFSDETNYCPSCGGKIIRNRLTLKTLFAHFSEQFLNYDNKFLKTFIHLFTKPEEVIDGYINGTRKKYVNVISYFAIAITISGLQIFILQKLFPASIDVTKMGMGDQTVFMEDFMSGVFEYNSLISMLIIPVFALMSKIVFYNIKKYNYTEQIVIYMYLIGQTTIVGAIFTVLLAFFKIDLGLLSSLTLPIMILYVAYALKNLYNIGTKRIIIKTFLFLMILLIFYIAFGILFFVIYVFTKYDGFENFFKAQKAFKNI